MQEQLFVHVEFSVDLEKPAFWLVFLYPRTLVPPFFGRAFVRLATNIVKLVEIAIISIDFILFVLCEQFYKNR